MTQPAPSFKDSKELGNATIYVLLVVALFAALSFILARQNDSSERSGLDEDKAAIIANQVLAYPLQVRQSLDMMVMTGESVSDLEFMLPGETGYDDPSDSPAPQVFHPLGGGLILPAIPADALDQSVSDPDAGWYLSRFSNVAWTPSAMTDVLLVAWGITEPLCQAINETLTGSTAIPALGNTIPNVFIDDTRHTGTNLLEFDETVCAGCEDIPALCVTSGGKYGFYTIVTAR